MRYRPRLPSQDRSSAQAALIRWSFPTAETQLEAPPLYSSLAGDPRLTELIQLFVEEMPERTARFREYFDSNDWDGLRRAARQMTGSADSYGFDQLTPYSAELEATLIRRAPEGEIAAALEIFLSQCARTISDAPR
jgi:HPt (histidine-containing phosphotransfer) domain-containing protein